MTILNDFILIQWDGQEIALKPTDLKDNRWAYRLVKNLLYVLAFVVRIARQEDST